MALTLGDNFSYQGAKPLDARLNYDTVAAMKAVADATMYNGCLAYCSETEKTYQWKSGNTVDETTGKWREFKSGGGGGGGETYTAGDGIDISEENVISTEKSQNGWMDEVIEKVPMSGALVNIANAFNRSDLYSTTERIVGQWTDGKPLYQKTIQITSGSSVNDVVDTNITSWNVDVVVDLTGIIKVSDNQYRSIHTNVYDGAYYTQGSDVWANVGSSSPHKIRFRTNVDFNRPVYLTIRYTKTTDSAIAIGSETEYSTDEKIIGSWIDGKPLYQKTIETVSPNAVNSVKKIIELESNCQIQNFFGFMGENGDIGNVNSRKPINYGNPNTGFYMHTYSGFGNDIHMLVTRSYEVNAPVWITLQYTKLS